MNPGASTNKSTNKASKRNKTTSEALVPDEAGPAAQDLPKFDLKYAGLDLEPDTMSEIKKQLNSEDPDKIVDNMIPTPGF